MIKAKLYPYSIQFFLHILVVQATNFPDENRKARGQGIANMINGFFDGMAGCMAYPMRYQATVRKSLRSILVIFLFRRAAAGLSLLYHRQRLGLWTVIWFARSQQMVVNLNNLS
ncbi:hypothetical protein [Paenibacillus monticola]|uniref:hypothetical protein n=1 Tax=Paenibacillus monticola TaxID=2666075 RepID=UPI001E30670A|nr:hypothetical protein [Paenibacillus monticola]